MMNPVFFLFFQIYRRFSIVYTFSGFMRGSRGGGQVVRTPSLKNHKNSVSKQNWSCSPEKLQSYQSRFDDGPLKVVFRSSLRQNNKNKRKEKKKNVFWIGPHLTKLSGSAHGVSYWTLHLPLSHTLFVGTDSKKRYYWKHVKISILWQLFEST